MLLGPYPQLRLWGQEGNAPIRIRTKMINTMVLKPMINSRKMVMNNR